MANNYLKNELIELIKIDDTIFDFIQEFALDGLWFWDTQNIESCWINQKLGTILGYDTPSQFETLNSTWSNIFLQNELSDIVKNINKYSSAFTTTLHYLHKDGTTITMNCVLNFIYNAEGNISRVLGANTIQKNTQKTEIDFYKTIGESTIKSKFLYIVKTDVFGNYTYINDYFYNVFGFTKDEILGTNALLSIIKEDHSACQETIMQCFVNPMKPFKVILRKRNKQKEIITNQWEFTGLVNDEGKTFEILCVGYNVSEKVKTENDLSILVSNMTDLLISVNYEGIVTFVSTNVTKLYQYELNEIVGKPYINFVHEEDVELAINAVRNTIATDTPFTNLEVRIKKKDGSYYWTNVNSSINPLNKETILLINDITARFDSLKQLKQTKELLEEISEVAHIGGWEYFPNSKQIYLSETTQKIYDYPSDSSMTLDKIMKFLKPKSKKIFSSAIKKSIHQATPFDLELEIVSAQGREIWLRVIIKSDFNDDGVCTRVYGTFQDIDQLKKAEIAREKSANLLKHLTKQVPGTLYQFQLFDDGRMLFPYVSRKLISLHGMELLTSEERSKILFGLIHPDDYKTVIEEIKKSSQTLALTDIEFRINLIGKERWFRAISTPERLKDNTMWHGYMSDITDKKLAEEELKRTKNFLLETNRVAKIGGWEVDLSTYTAYWSEITREIHEVEKNIDKLELASGINYYKEGYSRETIEKVFSECENNEKPFDVDVQLITAKNKEIWVRVIGKADFSIPHKKRIFGTFQDITEAKLAEVQLKRTRDLLEETNRVARVGGWSIDVASNTIYWSKMIKEIIEVPYDFEPTIEIGLLFYKEGLSRQLITDSVKNCISFGTPFEVDLQVVSTKGEEIWVKAIGKAELEGEITKRVYGIFQDINQSKKAEENAKSLQKLEVLLFKEKQLNVLKSRFIALTSHEFRTPLTGILGSAELIDLYTGKIANHNIKDKIQEHISHITSQVDRLTGIVTDVLTLEKTAEGKTVVKLQAVAIKAFLEKLTNELYVNLRDNRRVKLVLPEEEKEIFTDESILVHIMNNLISNAFKYSRGIKLSPEIHLLYFDKYFTITVKDYGMGIPAKDQVHLFESFFRASNVITTEGTGLGLSIAKEFSEKLGGQITFESQVGKGSSFILKLPY